VSKTNRLVKKITSHYLFWPIVCLLIVLLVNLIKTPAFFKIEVKEGVFYGYLIDIINRSSDLIILAVGMTLVVASSGGTDISVGSVCAIAGSVCVYLVGSGDSYNMPYIFAAAIAVGVATLCGMWNGFLVAKMKIQPMVATLILFTAGRGIAQLITQGNILNVKVKSYKYLGQFLPHVPLPTTLFIVTVVVLITLLVIKKTALGLYIKAVGVNAKAGRIVGINSSIIIFLTYAFCGLCAGISGLIISSRVACADANNAGLNIELDAILAVALGGNSLSGGKFTIAGSIIGAITIQALTTSLYAMRVSADQLAVFKAIVVVIIVSLQSAEFKKFVIGIKNKVLNNSIRKKVSVNE
jgi:simple sugar transport system permease protein